MGAGGASVAPPGPAEEALVPRLNLAGQALRVGGVSVALLGTATAPQLALDVTPNRHGPRLVDHVVDEVITQLFTRSIFLMSRDRKPLCFVLRLYTTQGLVWF